MKAGQFGSFVTVALAAVAARVDGQATLYCYGASFVGNMILCGPAGSASGSGSDLDPPPTALDAAGIAECSVLVDQINQVAKACFEANVAPSGETAPDDFFELSSLGELRPTASRTVADDAAVAAGLDYVVSFMDPLATTTAGYNNAVLIEAGSNPYPAGYADCDVYVGALQRGVLRDITSAGTCVLATTPSTTVTSTASSTAITTAASTATTTVASTATSTVGTTATTSASSSATTSVSSSATTSASSSAATSVSSTATTSVSSSATTSVTTSGTSTVTTTASSTATTTATTTKVTTEYATPMAPVVQCLLSQFEADNGTAFRIGGLSDATRQKLGRSFKLGLLGLPGNLLATGDITDVDVLRGVGEYRGAVVVRAHLADSTGSLEEAAITTAAAADAASVVISATTDAGTLISATSTSCSVVDARATADQMFRNWAHKRYDCPGTPPDYAYWVL